MSRKVLSVLNKVIKHLETFLSVLNKVIMHLKTFLSVLNKVIKHLKLFLSVLNKVIKHLKTFLSVLNKVIKYLKLFATPLNYCRKLILTYKKDTVYLSKQYSLKYNKLNMKKLLLLASLMIILNLKSFAQIRFESGYFINNQGIRTNCLIKNIDWKNNPKDFTYKLSSDATAIDIPIDSASEFGINKESTYKRFVVAIDRSREEVEKISAEKEPVLTTDTLFLKVLVSGKASLFYYEDADLFRYFYTVDDSPVKQLVYKSYKVYDSYKVNEYIKKNEQYKQQLWASLHCDKISLEDCSKIYYKAKDLIKVFKLYNETNSSVSVVIADSTKTKRRWLNLSIRPGLTFSGLTTTNILSPELSTSFEKKASVRLGVEGEFILPFNKNKWAILLEPTYQYYTSAAKNGHGETNEVSYKALEIPIGLRHSFFITNKSRIFINASYAFGVNLGSYYRILYGPTSTANLEIEHANTLLFGAGYAYNNRFSAELRLEPQKNMLNYFYWSSDYKTVSVIVGYRLF